MLAGNQLSEFNVLIGRMTKLQKLSLDWFTYIIPTQTEIILKTSHISVEALGESASGSVLGRT